VNALKTLLDEHADKFMIGAVVVCTIVIMIAVAGGIKPTTHKWTATYCLDTPCTGQSAMVHKEGYSNGEAAQSCPPTTNVGKGSIKIGTFSVPIFDTYTLIPDTCVVVKQ